MSILPWPLSGTDLGPVVAGQQPGARAGPHPRLQRRAGDQSAAVVVCAARLGGHLLWQQNADLARVGNSIPDLPRAHGPAHAQLLFKLLSLEPCICIALNLVGWMVVTLQPVAARLPSS